MCVASDAAAIRASIEGADDLLFLLGADFPDIEVAAVSFRQEHDADVVRADWDDEWVAWFAQTAEAAEQLRLMRSILPHLRGFVGPSVPMVERSSSAEAEWRRQWLAAPRLEGRPLRPELFNDQNRERLVRGLAEFCHQLHGFSVERARGLGAAPARQWREEHVELSRRSLAVLRPLVSWSTLTWARRWWRRLLDDEHVWAHPPALVHGGLSAERLLVDTFVQQLIAVDGWYRLRVADPALDFAALIDVYGTELVWRVVEQYGALGSTADAALFRRIRMQQTVRRFQDVVAAADSGGVESEEMTRALDRLG